jgi:hypothetical protein
MYRTMDDAPVTEFSVQRVKVKRQRGDSPDGTKGTTHADYVALRRAVPVSQPVPAAFKWIARLPAEVRPLNLLRQYPRIANNLALNWPDRNAFRHYLYDLLVDKRGGRKGFPQPVLQELLALREWFEHVDFVQGRRMPPGGGRPAK